jgi:hypothetical protein
MQGTLEHSAKADMQSGKRPDPKSSEPEPPWEESRLPGQRSGEGLKDIFKLLSRDIRRKAGLPPQEEPEKKDKKP